MEADAWKAGKSAGEGGEKHVQRPEVRKQIYGILQSLAG